MKKEVVKDVFQLTTEVIQNVVDMMESNFDSHAFILRLLRESPSVYGQLLIKHNNVTTAHAEISNFLRNLAKELGIKEKEHESESVDIFGIINPCALWERKK